MPDGAKSFCIATVPHTGSHSVVDKMQIKFVLPGSEPTRFPCWTHVDNMEWLRTTKARIFTTFRDPLLTAISWKARGENDKSLATNPDGSHRPYRFQDLWTNWLELRRTKHVPVLDISFNKVVRKNTKWRPDLYQAYEDKDAYYLKTEMPEFFRCLKNIPWNGEYVQEWYMN